MNQLIQLVKKVGLLDHLYPMQNSNPSLNLVADKVDGYETIDSTSIKGKLTGPPMQNYNIFVRVWENQVYT